MEKTGEARLSLPARRILVVDNNRDSRESLAEFLQILGHSVYTASDGIDALIQAGRFSPEIAFLDLRTPRMDGFELCARLRANTATQNSAVFALSAGKGESHAAKRASARFDAYLPKPPQLDVVEALVNAATADLPVSRFSTSP